MNEYDKLSAERKELQKAGNAPAHWSTASWQMFKDKYLYQAATPREQYQRIASTLAKHSPNPEFWEKKFFDAMWKGWLSPATPVLANTGTDRGLPVSCAGSFIADSINDIYNAKHEVAMLTKMGFGTASYLGDVRPRGADITAGGKASGIMPIIEGFQKDMEYVAQGTSRRGSWAGYFPIEHGDFDEVLTFLEQHPDGLNLGINISNEFLQKLDAHEPEAIRRYAKLLKTRMVTGKPYCFFPDKANDNRPQWYKDRGLDIKSSQLCNEIILHSSEDYTFTCVLASLNVYKWDEWKDTDLPFTGVVFLDCVVSEFLEKARGVSGLEKAIAFTEKGRAIGLGQCGFHSYLLEHNIPWGSLESYKVNYEMASTIQRRAVQASEWLASKVGTPEWMQGYGRRNTHLIAVAPTKSTSLIMGGVSEGINPNTAFVYTQRSSAGEVRRIDPILLSVMKKKGVFNKNTTADISEHMGSVQHVSWLSGEEKLVWRTAFEIDQMDVVEMASQRAPFIDQWQSTNLFFASSDTEEYVNEVHKKAFLDPAVLGLYYVYSKSDVNIQRDKDECLACQ